MLLFILFIIILLLGIGALILANRKLEWDSTPYNISFFGGVTSCFIGVIGVVICVAMTISVNIPSTQNKVRIECENTMEALISNYNYIQTIQDDKAKSVAIVEYNKEVSDFKSKILNEQYILNNIWINWYTTSAYKDIDVSIIVYIK